jgi:enamine deaminase RidA (YjgF/YER057c/UK114 family)
LSSDAVRRFGGDPPSPFEDRYGFGRVVVVGELVLVGGTTAITPDGAMAGETPREQTIEILRKIEHELGRVGAAMSDVVLVRVYVTDISRSEEVGLAHGEVFGEIRPVMTMVGIEALVDPRMLVEIEAVAVIRS